MPKEIIPLNSFTKGDCVVNGNFLLDESTNDLCTLVDYYNSLSLNPNSDYIPEEIPLIQYVYRDCGIDVDSIVPECSLVLDSYTLDVPVIKTTTVTVEPEFATCADFGLKETNRCDCNQNTQVTMFQNFNPYKVTPDGKHMVNPLSALKCCECWEQATCADFRLSELDACIDYVNNWEYSHRNYNQTNCDIDRVFIPDGIRPFFTTKKIISKGLYNCSTCGCASNYCPDGETCEWYGGYDKACDCLGGVNCDALGSVGGAGGSWQPWGSCLTCWWCLPPNCNVCASEPEDVGGIGKLMTPNPQQCIVDGQIPRGSTCPYDEEAQAVAIATGVPNNPCYECIDCDKATQEEKNQYKDVCEGLTCIDSCGADYYEEKPNFDCPNAGDIWMQSSCGPNPQVQCWSCTPDPTDCVTCQNDQCPSGSEFPVDGICKEYWHLDSSVQSFGGTTTFPCQTCDCCVPDDCTKCSGYYKDPPTNCPAGQKAGPSVYSPCSDAGKSSCYKCVSDTPPTKNDCTDPTYAAQNTCACTGVGCPVDCAEYGCVCPGGGSGNSNPQCGVGYTPKRCSPGSNTPLNPSGFSQCEFCEYCEQNLDDCSPCGYMTDRPDCGLSDPSRSVKCGTSNCWTACQYIDCVECNNTQCDAGHIINSSGSQFVDDCPSGYHTDYVNLPKSTGNGLSIGCMETCECCKIDSCASCGSQYSHTPQTNCPSGQLPTPVSNACEDAGFTNCYECQATY
jgi:hypothetical protein